MYMRKHNKASEFSMMEALGIRDNSLAFFFQKKKSNLENGL